MNAEKMEEWNRKVRTLYTWSHLYLGFKVAQVHSRLLPEQKRAAFWKTRHSKFAQAMWSNIADLRGWWVKVGQFLSTRGDLLPEEYVSELSKVQDMMPTSHFSVIKGIIEREMGCKVEDIFEWIDESALASASIGQVHKAKLKPGARALLRKCRPKSAVEAEEGAAANDDDEDDDAVEEERVTEEDDCPHIKDGQVELADNSAEDWGNNMVVLKVQHPNVDRMLLQDMELLKQLSWAFGLLERGVMFNDVLDEWGKESRMELDFRYEAYNQKYVHRCMREHRASRPSPSTKNAAEPPVHDHVASATIKDAVKIPSVLYASKRLLVMEYVNGFKCTDMAMIEKYKVDVNDLCTKIVESFADQIHVFGVFNADPHPGNIIIQLDPVDHRAVPVLLDWGLVKRFTQRQRIAFCKLIIAISQIDLMGLMSAFQDMGFKFKGNSDQHKKKHLQKLRHGDTDVADDGSGDNEPVIPVDPEIYMDAITVLFKNSAANTEESGPFISQEDKDAAWAKAKETKVSDVQSVNPLDDWPKDIIFFLRVASLLHGLTVQLKAQVPFFQIMLEKAEEAVRADMGIIPKDLQYIYKGHNAATLAGQYNCPYQELVFGDNISQLLKRENALPNQMPTVTDTKTRKFGVRSMLEFKLYKILSTLYGDGLLVGVQVCVWHRKFQRVDICLGRMGVYDSRPVNQRTLFTGFSLSNVIMITIILYLISKSKVRMTDCISEWWDGFIRGDKRLITIYDLLCHQTGIHSWLPSTLSLNQMCNYDYMIKILEQTKPVCQTSNCGHYPHVCVSYLYHHLLQTILKQPPGKYLKQHCLREWRLKHLQKLIYFPVPKSTPTSPAAETSNQLEKETSPLLTTPELQQLTPQTEIITPVVKSSEGGPSERSSPQNAKDAPVVFDFNLDMTSLISELHSTQKLTPGVMQSVISAEESVKHNREPELVKSHTRVSQDVYGSPVTMANTTQQPNSFNESSAGMNVSLGNLIGCSSTNAVHPYSSNDVYSRLATVSRDLGVAKMADAANMNRQTIGATTADLTTDSVERERLQKRKEWLQKVQAMQSEAAPVTKRVAHPGGKNLPPTPGPFLSKFPGRVSLMEQYMKDQAIASSKLLAIQALVSQKSEGLTAFQLMRKRPHLLDPMFLNAEPIIPLNIPFANARFSARALSTILHYTTRGAIIKEKVLQNALKPRTLDLSLEARVATGGFVPLFGLGYQLLPLKEITPCMSAKESIVNNSTIELRRGGDSSTTMPPVFQGTKHLFKPSLEGKEAPVWTTANVSVSYRLTKQSTRPARVTPHVRETPAANSSTSANAKKTLSFAEEPSLMRRDSTSSSSSLTTAEANGAPTTYGFGGSDTGGNLVFSIPSEQLTCCVLVNDHVSGAHISRVVLQEVLASFGLQVINNMSSLPSAPIL